MSMKNSTFQSKPEGKYNRNAAFLLFSFKCLFGGNKKRDKSCFAGKIGCVSRDL